jgi:hypothetical protein
MRPADEPPREESPKLPRNAAEYRAYYEAKRSAAAGDPAKIQMLRGWFFGDAERRLRSKCQVTLEEVDAMKADLEQHLQALTPKEENLGHDDERS